MMWLLLKELPGSVPRWFNLGVAARIVPNGMGTGSTLEYAHGTYSVNETPEQIIAMMEGRS